MSNMSNNISKNNIEMKALKQKHDSENKMWWEMQKFKAELYLKRKTGELNNLIPKGLTGVYDTAMPSFKGWLENEEKKINDSMMEQRERME